MKLKHRILGLLLILFSLSSLQAQVKGGVLVDSYKMDNKLKVDVYFFNPLDSVLARHPNFAFEDSIPNRERVNLWKDYLRESPVYVFVVKQKKEVIRYYCIRGNPEADHQTYFYQLEAIKRKRFEIDPFKPATYKHAVIKTYPSLRCGGSLFEQMSTFEGEEIGAMVDRRALFLGYRVRVTPYDEFKQEVNFYIQGDLIGRQ